MTLHDALTVDEMTGPATHQQMSDAYIREQISKYKWFVHVNFGNGITAASTSWPDEPPNSRHAGIGKFEFIVRRNLPDLQGKRVLDLGCNCGLMAIHMLRSGAAEVVGVDSERTWPNWREQAEFVRRALEWRCRATYNVSYHEADLRNLPTTNLGTFDVVLALNCLYYLEEPQIEAVMRHVSTISPVFLVQCNTHDHALGRRTSPAYMADAMRRNGFGRVSVDAPWDHPKRGFWPNRYMRPVVVGHV